MHQVHFLHQVHLYDKTCLQEKLVIQCVGLKSGDPNKKDLLVGNTAVHYAAQENYAECLKLLIDAGGHYDTKNNDGKSCLDLATGECFSMLESLSE